VPLLVLKLILFGEEENITYIIIEMVNYTSEIKNKPIIHSEKLQLLKNIHQ